MLSLLCQAIRLSANHMPWCRHRVELAAQRVEERQAQLSSKLAEKQRRVAAMEDERAAMLRALEDVRREIRRQEAQLK